MVSVLTILKPFPNLTNPNIYQRSPQIANYGLLGFFYDQNLSRYLKFYKFSAFLALKTDQSVVQCGHSELFVLFFNCWISIVWYDKSLGNFATICMRLTEIHCFPGKLSQLGTPNVTREDMESLMLRLAEAHSNSLIDEEGNDTHTNWSFSNSFFFAITVVTTIGELHALISYLLYGLDYFFGFTLIYLKHNFNSNWKSWNSI